MSESVFDKIDKLSNKKRPRKYKTLKEWQKKLIIEYYPAVDYEDLMEFCDAPKSTMSGIARRNGVKRLKSKADKEKLKPCPMCGKTETLRIMEGDRVWIECMKGEDACGLSTGFFDTIAEAIAAWNRRVDNHCKKYNGSGERGGETPAGEKPA